MTFRLHREWVDQSFRASINDRLISSKFASHLKVTNYQMQTTHLQNNSTPILFRRIKAAKVGINNSLTELRLLRWRSVVRMQESWQLIIGGKWPLQTLKYFIVHQGHSKLRIYRDHIRYRDSRIIKAEIIY